MRKAPAISLALAAMLLVWITAAPAAFARTSETSAATWKASRGPLVPPAHRACFTAGGRIKAERERAMDGACIVSKAPPTLISYASPMSTLTLERTEPRVCESPRRSRFFRDEEHMGLGCDDPTATTALDGFARMRYHIAVQ